jgi:hypothetical protein
MVYTLWVLADDWAFAGLVRLLGVHGLEWGEMNNEIAQVVTDVVFETLRIALLAAAFDLCISVGAERRGEAAAAKEELARA